MDWSKLPDLFAVGLLAWAFASVGRKSHVGMVGQWLAGWLLIALHFGALMFATLRGSAGTAALVVGMLSLVWAGLLFTLAAVPYKQERSRKWMFVVLQSTYSLYVATLMLNGPAWLLNTSAVLIAIGPLTIALVYLRRFQHLLRWLVVGLSLGLGLVLLSIRNRPGASDLSLDAVLFTVYLACGLHVWYTYRRKTAGAFISISAFFAWAAVFIVSPLQTAYLPSLQIESEVWNLPKYVVAVGMILLLLEDQLEYNKHLALHDTLTGLPNRRLFQDRLANALERARRTGAQTALLMLDLDRFKQVNDTYGHHAGDLLLQNVGKLLSTRVRRSDTVARTGGDEFAVVLESPTSRAEAEHVGASLLALLHDPIVLEDYSVQADASLGIALFPEDARDMQSLCIVADLRMYEDKRSRGFVAGIEAQQQRGMELI